MARCGCNAASATTCDAIVLCVAANLGPGLRYDGINGVLAVRISGDAGNAASFGTDGGVYVPGGDVVPDPASGRRTIAGLPPRFAGGSGTGAGSMTPLGSPEGIEYGIANRLDLLNISTFALADDVAVARWDSPEGNLDLRTDNPSTMDLRFVSSAQLPSLLCDAGARDTPTGRFSGAPTSLLTPDGGWFGFYANNYTPMPLTEVLTQVAARAVVYLANFGGELAADVERYIGASIDAVMQVGAQDWAFISVAAYVDDGVGGTTQATFAPWVSDVIGAGMTPVVDLFDDNAGGFTVTPAQVISSGAQWVRFAEGDDENNGTGFDRIQDFLDAGLDVIVHIRSSRQFEADIAWDMGVRGVTSDSPVYTRGARGETGDLDYRKEIVIPGLITRTMMEGSLTHLTNGVINESDVGWARQSDVGRYFSAQYGWEGGIGPHLNAQLLGELCPYEVTADYRLRIRFRVDPTQAAAPAGTIPKLGVFFNAPDDRDITYFEPDDAPSYINGYWFNIRVGTVDPGLVVMGKFNNGDFSILDQSMNFPSITIGTWINFNIHVTATSITLGVGHGATELSATVNDTDHRGGYAFYAWEDDYIAPADNTGFAHGYSAYDSFATGSPMYEDLT